MDAAKYLGVHAGTLAVYHRSGPMVPSVAADILSRPDKAYRLGAAAYVKKCCVTYATTTAKRVPQVGGPSAESKRQRVARNEQ